MEAGKAEDFAVVFFARMDNPGLRLMCRPSYEERASSPFDYPLSSRFDENDSVLLFDKALIPGRTSWSTATCAAPPVSMPSRASPTCTTSSPASASG